MGIGCPWAGTPGVNLGSGPRVTPAWPDQEGGAPRHGGWRALAGPWWSPRPALGGRWWLPRRSRPGGGW